jgi:uncharacterized protein (DUF1697 family)
LEAAFSRDRGFAVPTIVFARDEFAAVAADADALSAEHPGAARHYAELLRTVPTPSVAARLEAGTTQQVHVVVRGGAVHTFLATAAPAGGGDTAGLAKLLGVSTNRNATVINAISQRRCCLVQVLDCGEQFRVTSQLS